MAKYYGPFEIDTMVENESGVQLTFKERTNDQDVKTQPEPLFVPECLIHMIKDEPTDYNEWYTGRLSPLVDEIITLFAKYNIFIGAGEGVASDISWVFDRVIDFLRSGRKQVEDEHWGAPEHAKTMLQLLDHLKKIKR